MQPRRVSSQTASGDRIARLHLLLWTNVADILLTNTKKIHEVCNNRRLHQPEHELKDALKYRPVTESFGSLFALDRLNRLKNKRTNERFFIRSSNVE